LQRTPQYASFLVISRALHLHVFDQPGRKSLFQQTVVMRRSYGGADQLSRIFLNVLMRPLVEES
jgi:hypothetical protein